MKPRLLSAPLTPEDFDIYVRMSARYFRAPRVWQGHVASMYDLADRRDADRMMRIMTLGCRFCGSNSMHGEVHTSDCIYVIDPSARKVWLRKGVRIIE
jgi:hypothetical protein